MIAGWMVNMLSLDKSSKAWTLSERWRYDYIVLKEFIEVLAVFRVPMGIPILTLEAALAPWLR